MTDDMKKCLEEWRIMFIERQTAVDKEDFTATDFEGSVI
jgi:hypothetical protein